MIYGEDVAVEYPVADLYDTGMMKEYLDAVKSEYERGIKELEEFTSKYGDFVSPFKKDVETWDRLTMDPIVQAYDLLLSNGIDPLRSQEGRSLLSYLRMHIPRNTLSELRLSAAAGLEYLKNRAKMQTEGTYNPEFENFMLNGVSFDDYDTTQLGMWDRTSPSEYKGLRTITDPWFKNRTAKYKKTEGPYDYYGYDVDDMRTAANTQMLAFLASDYGKFFYNRARNTALSTAVPGESEESINARARDILMDDIVSANSDYLMNDRKVNPIYLENLKYQHDLNKLRVAAANKKAKGDDDQNTYNYHQSLFTRGALSLVPGTKGAYTTYGSDLSALAASQYVKPAFLKWKRLALGRYNPSSTEYKNAFLNYTGNITEDPEVTLSRFGKTSGEYPVSRRTNTKQVLLSKNDLKNIESTDTYVLNALGYTGNHTNDAAHFNKYLKRGQNLTAAPTGRVFTKMDKNGRLAQYAQVNVYTSTLNYDDKDNPNTVTSIDDKFLQQAYIPIQYSDAVPNNSTTTPIFPSENIFSELEAYEGRVRTQMGNSMKDKHTGIDSPW